MMTRPSQRLPCNDGDGTLHTGIKLSKCWVEREIKMLIAYIRFVDFIFNSNPHSKYVGTSCNFSRLKASRP